MRLYAACDCFDTGDAEQLFKQSDIVFHGRIIEILQEEELRNRVNFRIKNIWKGKPGKTIEILAKRHTAICETGYVPDIEYVIYAKWEKEAGFYSTKSCGGWSKYYVDVQAGELRKLRRHK